MFNAIQKLLSTLRGGRKLPPNSQPSQPSQRGHSQSPPQAGSEAAKRGQLVQVIMRRLVRRSGIPLDWLQCQFQVINSSSRGQGIFVRLVVKHWDERLMKYAFAFQKALLTDIVEFEPTAAQWLYGITWQLEVAGSCPVTELPGHIFWKTGQGEDPFEIIPMPASAMSEPPAKPAPVPKPAVTAPVIASIASVIPTLDPPDDLPPLPAFASIPAAPENDTAKDLEQLFAIRDKELQNLAVNNLLPVGYEKTEPSPLSR